MEINKITLEIATKNENILVDELSEFLYHFRAAYAAAIEYGFDEGINAIDENQELIAEELIQNIKDLPWEEINHLAFCDLEDNTLVITEIKRENPLIMVLSGSIIAIILAVILSGGEIEIAGKTFRAKLNPIGYGILSLRKAFGRSKRIKNKSKKRKRK